MLQINSFFAILAKILHASKLKSNTSETKITLGKSVFNFCHMKFFFSMPRLKGARVLKLLKKYSFFIYHFYDPEVIKEVRKNIICFEKHLMAKSLTMVEVFVSFHHVSETESSQSVILLFGNQILKNDKI